MPGADRVLGPLAVGLCLLGMRACGIVAKGPSREPDTVSAGAAATPGTVTVFTIQAVNQSDHPLTLEGVKLLRDPGDPAPVLVHYAVFPGLDTLDDVKGWPPPRGGGPGPHGSWPIVPLRGFVVTPHQWVAIALGVLGSKVGTVYVMGGVTAAYRKSGATFSSPLSMVNLLCVDRPARAALDACSSGHDRSLLNRALAYVRGLPGQ